MAPVPPGRPPLPLPVWGPLKLPFEPPLEVDEPPRPFDEPPSPFGEPPSGLVPAPVEVAEPFELLESLEELQPFCLFAPAGLLFVV